jgi:aryl-alcohol dehydrogenase-like predicted oxidoreductase
MDNARFCARKRGKIMRYRELGRTGWQVSEVSFGAWAIGGSWGSVNDAESQAALRRAIELGVNFIDTADVYGDGRSERLIGKTLRDFPGQRVYVATKAGRRLSPHVAAGYTPENITAFVERSLRNLDVESIDLLQLHCPPTQVYYRPELFAALDDMVAAGKLRNYGVSVEKVEEGLKAMEYPGVQSVQVIFNMFRQRPAELLFPQAQARRVGVLTRVPLASGLLTGKLTASSTFSADDHRTFNRRGEMFDMGETFAGVPYDLALAAVEELRKCIPPSAGEGATAPTMAQFALRWILMFDGVTCAIPGAKRPAQVEENCRADDVAALSDETMAAVREIYDRTIRPFVHQRW